MKQAVSQLLMLGVLCTLASGCVSRISITEHVSGVVVDGHTLKPVSRATVKLMSYDTNIVLKTATMPSNGCYDIPPVTELILITHIPYDPRRPYSELVVGADGYRETRIENASTNQVLRLERP